MIVLIMSNQITDRDSVRIRILSETRLYTPQEIALRFIDIYTVEQIRNHLKTKAHGSFKKLKR